MHHPSTMILPSPNQPFRNRRRSNTSILLQLYQRLGVAKSLSKCHRKLPWKTFLTLLGWGPHVSTACRLSNVVRCNNTFISLQYPWDFAYGIRNPCHVLLPYRELWRPARPWHHHLVRVFVIPRVRAHSDSWEQELQGDPHYILLSSLTDAEWWLTSCRFSLM